MNIKQHLTISYFKWLFFKVSTQGLIILSVYFFMIEKDQNILLGISLFVLSMLTFSGYHRIKPTPLLATCLDKSGFFANIYTTLSITTGLGFLLLPYVKQITSMLGQFVATLTELQPVPMTMAIAVMFAMMIVSPIATVGIATAISLSGIASGAANLGICAAGFGLCIAGWKANAVPTSLAHFIGSPKMQMANVVKKPKIMLPVICSAAITGSLASFLDLQGTPFSAGFGFSGLIGPINALALKADGWTVGNIITTFIAFLVVPVVLGFAFNYLFNEKLGIASSDDYKLDFN